MQLLRYAMGVRISMLLRHPPIHQLTGALGSTQMLHPGRPGMVRLPSRELDERLVFIRLFSLEAIEPCQPPIATNTLLIATNIALITFAIRHTIAPAAESIISSATPVTL